MTRRVSGIVLAPLDSQALVKPVASAVQSKVPVVIIDSDLKSDQYVSFVATDNYKGGVLAAITLASCLTAKATLSSFATRLDRQAPKPARPASWIL